MSFHEDQPVLTAGVPLEQAHLAMLMVHGRGANAHSILDLRSELDQPGLPVAYLAPQAAGNVWYPNRFLFPLESNEPWLSSAFAFLARTLEHIAAAGIPPERTLLLGFSQGACLALEFAARRARRYGGVIGLSGSVIGPDGLPRLDDEIQSRPLAGTPVFLGCSDIDPHIPKARVEFSAQVLERLGGQVTMRLYPGMGHTVNQDELDFVRRLLADLDEEYLRTSPSRPQNAGENAGEMK